MAGNLTNIIEEGTSGSLSGNVKSEEFGNDSVGDDGRHSIDSTTIKSRPPLRHIDKYVRPEFPCCDMSKRYTVAFMASIGFMISFGMRCNLGVAIAKMIESSQTTEDGNYTKPDFIWGRDEKGIVESSYFWGYLLTQIPGGILAVKYRPNLIFGTTITLSAALNLLVPSAINPNFGVMMIVRIFQGLIDGVTYPACHAIWRWWAPPLERTRLATLAFFGSYGGVVVGMPVSGWLAEEISWKAPFYFYGISGIVWYLFWLWLVFERPSKHPIISAKELYYIENAIGPMSAKPPTFHTTPWKDIFSSKPVYAIVVASFCRSWTFYILLLSQPTYFKEEFNFSLAVGGALAAMPHVLMTIVVPVGGILADYFRRNNILTTTQVRKIFNCGGFGLEALFLLLVGLFGDKNGFALISSILAFAFSGFAISGFNVNHLDIAFRYASILMGISNGVGMLSGLLCPIVLQMITRDDTQEEWARVFFLAAFIHFSGVIFYWIYASGDLQPWAEPKPKYYEDPQQRGNGNCSSERVWPQHHREDIAPIPKV